MIHSYPVTAAVARLLASATPMLKKDAGDPLEMIAKKFGDHSAQVMEKLGATNDKLRGIDARIFELEQKGARRGGDGSESHSSGWGAHFVRERETEIKSITESRGRTSLQMKATLTTATTDAAGSVGDLATAYRDQALMMPKRRLLIRNLLNVIQISSGSVEYPEQVGRATNAGMVAEGDTKPSSDVQFEMKQVPTRVIAHWMKASRQVLEDVPQLSSIIDQELRYGLALKEESQILYGDGTGQNLRGLVPQATAYTAPITIEGINKIDVIGLAILQASLTDISPDGVVIHPYDWWEMRLLKDAQGNYILGNPQTVTQPVLFGLPAVVTPAMTATDFLVGAFNEQTLYDRWEARVEVGFVNDDFIKNLVTILGEERVGLAAKRPQALITGDFNDAIAA